MTMSKATPQNFRIASRRAQSLYEKHLASKRPPGSTVTKINTADKSADTPWPTPLRYTFYTVCAAAVPFSIGSMIAMSPRIRDSLVDETDPDDNGMTTNNLVHLVRQYWGDYDYVPPTDRVEIDNVEPGRRLEWQEDNWSSFLAFLGLYTSKDGQSSVRRQNSEGDSISLQNEPPANVRDEQTRLARFLSTEYNPSGVGVRLSLLQIETFGGDFNTNTTHEFEFRLPAHVSLSPLRNVLDISGASDAVQKLNDLFPGMDILQSDDPGIDWNGSYRCVLDFLSNRGDESDEKGSNDLLGDTSSNDSESNCTSSSAVFPDTSKIILSNTSSHSSWAYVPEQTSFGSSNTSPSKLNSSASTSGSAQAGAQNINNARIEHLQYQISVLNQELKDPSSLRDRGNYIIIIISLSHHIYFSYLILHESSKLSPQMTCMLSLKLQREN